MSTFYAPTWTAPAGMQRTQSAGYRWAYGLFVLVTATLFLRPSELFPSLDGWRIYLCLIIACLALALPRVADQLTMRRLAVHPVSACLVGLLAAVMASHLSHLFFWGARYYAWEYMKLLAYYLLFVGLMDSHKRLRNFLLWIVLFVVGVTGLALLDAHGVIQLDSLQVLEHEEIDSQTGNVVVFQRLRSTGIFNDPNDLALILVVGAVAALYFLCEPGWGVLRYGWLAPLALFAYGLFATQSRGGFLACLTALSVLTYFRFGWRGAILAGAVLVPATITVFSGRMTELDAIVEGTGQTRIQVWSEGLHLLRQYPFFGIGYEMHAERLGMAAHNSFLHCFTEMGLVGGSLFLGAFIVAGTMLHRLKREAHRIPSPQARQMLPFVSAIVAGYAGGMLALSRSYVVPTYLVLGLATAYVRLAAPPRAALPRFTTKMLLQLVVTSMLFLACSYILVRVLVRWS